MKENPTRGCVSRYLELNLIVSIMGKYKRFGVYHLLMRSIHEGHQNDSYFTVEDSLVVSPVKIIRDREMETLKGVFYATTSASAGKHATAYG